MPPELMNLVPSDMTDAFRRDYFIRLATVSMLALAALIVIHGILLAPTYIFLETQIEGRQTQLKEIAASLNTTEEQQVNERLGLLESDTTYLKQLGTATSASGAVTALLGISRPGIHIAGFTFTAPQGSAGVQMTLTGIADTRETLRSYVLALQGVPFISSVDLPVSAYAKDKDIDFTMTLTGSFTP